MSDELITPPVYEEEPFDLLAILITLAKHKKLIASLTLGVMVISTVLALLKPDLYTAEATILPPQQSQSNAAAMLGQLGALAGIAGDSLGIKNPSDLYVGMLRSRTVLDDLIQKYNLQQVYKVKTLVDARKRLAMASSIANGKDGLITIDVDDQDPRRAAAIANSYVSELYKLNQALATTEASQRRLFFERELQQAKNELTNSENALKQTQENTGLIQLDGQAHAIISAVAGLKARISATEIQMQALRSFATPQNPEYMQLSSQIAAMKAQLAKMEQKPATAEGNELISAGKIPEAGLDYMRGIRDVKYHAAVFELLAKQYEAAKMDEAKGASMIQVLDKAAPPERKSKPNRLQIVILWTVVGFFLSLFLAFILDGIETRYQDPHIAGRLLQLRAHLLRQKS